MYSDRPGATFAGHVLGKGQIQLQSGFTIGSSGNDDILRVNTQSVETDLRFGLSERFELGSTLTYQRFESQVDGFVGSGLSSISLAARYQLVESEEAGRPDLALLGFYDVNGLSDDFSPSLNGARVLVSLMQPIAESFSLSLNAGAVFVSSSGLSGDIDGLEVGLRYTANFSFAFSNRLSAFLETYGQEFFGLWQNGFNGGFAYRLSDRVQLDAFGGFLANTGISNEYGSIGVTVLWP